MPEDKEGEAASWRPVGAADCERRSHPPAGGRPREDAELLSLHGSRGLQSAAGRAPALAASAFPSTHSRVRLSPPPRLCCLNVHVITVSIVSRIRQF